MILMPHPAQLILYVMNFATREAVDSVYYFRLQQCPHVTNQWVTDNPVQETLWSTVQVLYIVTPDMKHNRWCDGAIRGEGEGEVTPSQDSREPDVVTRRWQHCQHTLYTHHIVWMQVCICVF